jgi:RimJ/RimL family protein N-acetyltransferase
MTKPGSLVCVGVGMTLGSHLTPLSRSYIEQADVVFTGLSDGIMELWLARMHPDVRSLQQYYQDGKPRSQTYREMVEVMLTEVRAGKRVCGAFYGHPGVFALPPRKALAIARAEGYAAHMEPGVSAEDCLYADLEIDPGEVGCQHYEASQLMFYRRRIDPTAYLVLWQIGIAGDQAYSQFSTGAGYRQVLVDILTRDYDPDHEVIVYRAATLPTHRPGIRRLKLQDLPRTDLDIHMTLVIPPARALEADPAMRRRLASLKPSSRGPARRSGRALITTEPTARIRLRPMDEADRALFCSLYTDPCTMQMIGPPLTRVAALRSFGKALQLSRQARFARRFYAIVEVSSGKTLGIGGIHRSHESDRRMIEVGIVLPPGLQGQGYGKEILAALVQRVFRNLRVAEVFARADPRNAGALGILRAVGFRKRSAQESDELWSVTAKSSHRRNSRASSPRPKSRDHERQVRLRQ